MHRGPTPPLTPQTKVDACIQNFFRVSTLYRVGEGELQENLEKDALFYEKTLYERKLWKLHYCPKNFCPLHSSKTLNFQVFWQTVAKLGYLKDSNAVAHSVDTGIS